MYFHAYNCGRFAWPWSSLQTITPKIPSCLRYSNNGIFLQERTVYRQKRGWMTALRWSRHRWRSCRNEGKRKSAGGNCRRSWSGENMLYLSQFYQNSKKGFWKRRECMERHIEVLFASCRLFLGTHSTCVEFCYMYMRFGVTRSAKYSVKVRYVINLAWRKITRKKNSQVKEFCECSQLSNKLCTMPNKYLRTYI